MPPEMEEIVYCGCTVCTYIIIIAGLIFRTANVLSDESSFRGAGASFKSTNNHLIYSVIFFEFLLLLFAVITKWLSGNDANVLFSVAILHICGRGGEGEKIMANWRFNINSVVDVVALSWKFSWCGYKLNRAVNGLCFVSLKVYVALSMQNKNKKSNRMK